MKFKLVRKEVNYEEININFGFSNTGRVYKCI